MIALPAKRPVLTKDFLIVGIDNLPPQLILHQSCGAVLNQYVFGVFVFHRGCPPWVKLGGYAVLTFTVRFRLTLVWGGGGRGLLVAKSPYALVPVFVLDRYRQQFHIYS